MVCEPIILELNYFKLLVICWSDVPEISCCYCSSVYMRRCCLQTVCIEYGCCCVCRFTTATGWPSSCWLWLNRRSRKAKGN